MSTARIALLVCAVSLTGGCLQVSTDGDYVQVSVGAYHSCGLRGDGTVICWGCRGESAQGLAVDHGQCDPPPLALETLDAGYVHNCGLTGDGEPVCWGAERAELDFGQAAVPDEPLVSISAGGAHSCGVHEDGSSVCWGCEIGDRPDIDLGQCVLPAGFAPILELDAGFQGTCGAAVGDEANCWGAPGYAPQNSIRPVHGIRVGRFTACGLDGDGQLVCWGCDETYAGNEGALATCEPPAGRFASLDVGPYHACALDEAGGISCWGDAPDVPDPPEGPFGQVSVGGEYEGVVHVCGLRTDGHIECWGSNRHGAASPP